jgi:hypothetical protein
MEADYPVDLPTAYALVQQAQSGTDRWLSEALAQGEGARDEERSFDECPYPPERSQRRRAVWQLAWLMRDAQLRA